MTAVNIAVENDADFRRSFLYQTAGGMPIDLTNSDLLMMLRRNAKDATALLELSTHNGAISLLEATGTFQILITKAQLEQLPTGTYQQSLIKIDNGSYTKVWRGTLTNDAGPSR